MSVLSQAELRIPTRKFQSTSLFCNGTLFAYEGTGDRQSRFLWLFDLEQPELVAKLPYKQIFSSSFPKNFEVTLFIYSNSTKHHDEMILYTPSLESPDDTSFYTFQDISNINPNKLLSTGGPGSRLGHGIESTTTGNIWAFGGLNTDPHMNSTGYFFLFDRTTGKWQDLTHLATQYKIPNLVYPAFNNVNDKYLVVLGGALPNTMGTLSPIEFNKLYKFEIERNIWSTHDLVNCPSKPRIGHSVSKVKDRLIIIGGTDKPTGPDMNIYDDMYSLNLSDFTCTKIIPKDLNNHPREIKRAWHADSLVDNQLILTFGITNSTDDSRMIVLDTNSWIIQERFIPPNPLMPSNHRFATTFNERSPTNTLVFSLLGAFVVLIIICSFFYFIILRRKAIPILGSNFFGKKTDSILPSAISNPGWIDADNYSLKFNHSTIFTLTHLNSSNTNLLQDTQDDLKQLNEPHIPYRRWSSEESTLRSHIVLDQPIPLGITRTLFDAHTPLLDKNNEETLISQSENRSDYDSSSDTHFTK